MKQGNFNLGIYLLGGVLMFMGCSSPKALFTYQSNSTDAPASASFTNLSTNATEYEWDFGDETTSHEFNPKHIFTTSGRHEIKLIAKNKNKKSEYKSEIVLNAPHDCLVAMTTTKGTMVFKLYDSTPLHKDNFTALIEKGYYDSLLFHRVIQNFMVQGGDPDSRRASSNIRLGIGGPNYTIPAEIRDTLYHIRGALAAARKSDNINPKKESSGSQFYIVHGRPASASQLENLELQKDFKYSDEARKIMLEVGGSPALDQEYTVFGQLIDGWDVLDAIAAQKTDNRDRPFEDVRIIKMSVIK